MSHWLDVSLASSSVSILILALRFHLLDWRLRRLLDLGCHHHRRRCCCCSCSGSAGWLIGCEAGQMLTLSGGRWRHTRGSFIERRSSSTSCLIPKFNNTFTTTGISKKEYPVSVKWNGYGETHDWLINTKHHSMWTNLMQPQREHRIFLFCPCRWKFSANRLRAVKSSSSYRFYLTKQHLFVYFYRF